MTLIFIQNCQYVFSLVLAESSKISSEEPLSQDTQRRETKQKTMQIYKIAANTDPIK